MLHIADSSHIEFDWTLNYKHIVPVMGVAFSLFRGLRIDLDYSPLDRILPMENQLERKSA